MSFTIQYITIALSSSSFICQKFEIYGERFLEMIGAHPLADDDDAQWRRKYAVKRETKKPREWRKLTKHVCLTDVHPKELTGECD